MNPAGPTSIPSAERKRPAFMRLLGAYLLPLLFIALLAAGHIPAPLDGDQTVFMMGAETLSRGGTLYADFWDTKQPGIFLYYWLAGETFGYTSVGIHLFELLLNLLLAAWMIRLLRPRLSYPVLASMAPVMAIGGYYAIAGDWELTQDTAVSSLPLFACLAAATMVCRTPFKRRLAWFASGIAAGAAVLFKLLLAPIVLGIWVMASLSARRLDAAPWRELLLERWIPASLGTLLVLGATAVWFASVGAIEPLLWTAFAYPVEAVMTGTASPGRLVSTLRWGLAVFWPLVLLALLTRLRLNDGAADRLFSGAAAWWGMGLVVILVQRLSWWPYHLLLLMVPVALLAVNGIDALAVAVQRRLRVVVPATLALLIAILAFVPAIQRSFEVTSQFPPQIRNATDLIDWQRRHNSYVDHLWTETAFMRSPHAAPGPIYVFGDPRTIALSGRRQAIAINGWSWESYAKRQWDELPGAIAAAQPAYVGIEPAYERLVRKRAPSVMSWLKARYAVVQAGPERTWYVRKAMTGRP